MVPAPHTAPLMPVMTQPWVKCNSVAICTACCVIKMKKGAFHVFPTFTMHALQLLTEKQENKTPHTKCTGQYILYTCKYIHTLKQALYCSWQNE